jgi:bloom syndrome protein
MTINNLKNHLRWLVDRGQPDLSAVDVLLTRSDVDVHAQVQQSQSHAKEPDTKNECETTCAKNEPELKYDKDGDCLLQDANMARLNLASSSATKPPRMRSIKSDDAEPKTPSSGHRKTGSVKLGDTYRSEGALLYATPRNAVLN